MTDRKGTDSMRVMGLDFGSKTVGVSVSDPLGVTAQGVEIIRRTSENKLRQTLARIEALAREYEVETFVLGFPKNMNNTIGDRAEKSLAFKETLERRTGIPVVMWDERLTTVEANRTLMESGVRRENRKEYVDKLAAVYILQGYLDSEGMKNGKNEICFCRRRRGGRIFCTGTDPHRRSGLYPGDGFRGGRGRLLDSQGSVWRRRGGGCLRDGRG